MQHEPRFDRPCPGKHRHEKAPGHAVFAGPGDKWIAGAVRLELTARGFGVDVGERSQERGRAGVTQFSPQIAKQVVLIWCWKQPEKVNVQLGVKL